MPADSGYSFSARVVAAWLAAEAGASLDAVEDARLAVDEVVGAFVVAGVAADVRLWPEDGSIRVDVEGPDDQPGVSLSPMAQRILSVVAGSCDALPDGRRGFALTLRI